MKIVVLDSFTLNPGDLSWSGFSALGDCTFHEHTPSDQVVNRAAGADVVLTNKTVLSAEVIAALPELRYIGVLATGYNVVDVAAASARGIIVTNVPAYGTASVAQATFALLLELTNHVGHLSRTVSEGRWSECRDFCYWDAPLVELAGMTMGIVGMGTIGQEVARLARAFGMQVIAHSRTPREVEGVSWTTSEELFRNSDVVSLHCPLTPETAGLINASTLELMKKSAFLINTSRGPLVLEADLADALNQGRLAGAALDVLSVEPPRAGNVLIGARNCIITPHVAWATQAARQRLMESALHNLRGYRDGCPPNVVKPVN